MAVASQQALLLTNAQVGGLIHENFKGKVVPHLEHIGPTLSLFKQAGPGEYTLTGDKLVFAGDVTYAAGAMATDGNLPDTDYVDPVNFETVPTRQYVRRAVDNFNVARWQDDGTFENFIGRVMEQMWDAFERSQNRHIHGSSNATVCVTDSRTSNTIIVVKDGYGHVGASPLMFLEPGMRLSWLDASNSFAVGGVGTISSINYATKTITFVASIENGSGTPTIVAGDVWVFPTSATEADNHFVTERGLAPLGLLDLIDPLSRNTAYLTVTEASFPRVKPIRTAATNYGEVELMEWFREIESKSQSPVTVSTHTFTTSPGAVLELAKTLLPYTQIQQKAGTSPVAGERCWLGARPSLRTPTTSPMRSMRCAWRTLGWCLWMAMLASGVVMEVSSSALPTSTVRSGSPTTTCSVS